MGYLLYERDEKTGKLTVKLTETQARFVQCDKPICVFIGGKQSGKTLSASVKLAKLIAQRGEGTYLLVEPTFDLVRAVIPKFLEVLEVFGLIEDPRSHKINAHEIHCTNGAIIYYRSADNPDRVESFTAKAAWLDEAQQDPENTERVFEIFEARTAVEKGQIILTATIPPDPLAWQHHWLYRRIWSPWEAGDPDIQIFRASSLENPRFSRKKWERLKRTLPPEVFAAEYEGKFVESLIRDSLVLPSTVKTAQERWRELIPRVPRPLYDWLSEKWPGHAEPLPDHQHGEIDFGEIIDVAVDVAAYGGDRSVATVRWGDLVLTQIDWGGQSTAETAHQLLQLGGELRELGYHPRFWVDRPGMGQGVLDQLLAAGEEANEYHPQHAPLSEPERFRDLKGWLGWRLRLRLMGEDDWHESPREEALPPLQPLVDQLLAWRFAYDNKQRLYIIDPPSSPDFADSYLISLLSVYMTSAALVSFARF